jgi:hypothetical protein
MRDGFARKLYSIGLEEKNYEKTSPSPSNTKKYNVYFRDMYKPL